MTDALALELARHSEAQFEDLLGGWRWACVCGHSFGQLGEGGTVPPGVPVVTWRMAEHWADIVRSMTEPIHKQEES
jgi:hypothetical protein